MACACLSAAYVRLVVELQVLLHTWAPTLTAALIAVLSLAAADAEHSTWLVVCCSLLVVRLSWGMWTAHDTATGKNACRCRRQFVVGPIPSERGACVSGVLLLRCPLALGG
jgi:hypothetical protein